jgi:hypothetical protein
MVVLVVVVVVVVVVAVVAGGWGDMTIQMVSRSFQRPR